MKFYYWLLKTINQIHKSNELNGKVYVFTTLRYLPFPIHQELFMANILAKKGAKVYIILDNGLFEHWDTYQIQENTKRLNPYKYRFTDFSYLKTYLHCKLLLFLYGDKNITILKTKSIVDKKVIENIQLSENDEANAISSVRRYFGTGVYDEKDPKHVDYYKKCEHNCKVSILIGKYIINNIKPDKFITSHGIYSLWGSLYFEVSKTKIPSYIYGYHTYSDDEALFTNTLAQTLSLDSSWLSFDKKNETLLPEYDSLISDYFEKRIQHKTKDTTIYYGGISKFKEINIVKDNENTMNIGIFPNIIWDGDVVQRDKYFKGVLDWVLKTIKLAETSKHNFIIRFHPAEATLFTDSLRLKDVIIDKYPIITSLKNVTLIDSDLKIDTYKFIQKNIDVGIVYDGILAMELTYMKIPVISPSTSRFSAGNFVINPSTEEEYYRYLNQQELITEYFSNRQNIDLEFKKYAYWYLFEAGYFMSIYDKKEFGKISYNQKSLNDIRGDRFKRFEQKLKEIN
jgi:hypothetical protein